MFKFGFSGPDKDEEPCNDTEKEADKLVWRDAEEVILFRTPFQSKPSSTEKANMVVCGDHEIGLVIIPEAKLEASDLLQEVEKSHSDLLPAKYEGGLKVWECTQDIGEFIAEEEIDESLAGKRVLDLGCGCGVLGIIALESGAVVDFQDYNKEVIELFTIPNVILNAEEEHKEISTDKAKFYCGDWNRFSQLIGEDSKYDVILTSETIYNPANYTKLADFFLKHLATDGYVLLGAKGYYFGVGGSVEEFKRCLTDKYPRLDCESVWSNEKGVKRDILKIKLKRNEPKD